MINVIGNIISILTLLITFFTLLIMKKQREDANRPYLVLDYNEIKFDEVFHITQKNFDIEESFEEMYQYHKIYDIDKNPFDFKVVNIGNGVARDIKVRIKVKNIDIIKKDEKMYIKDNMLVVEYPCQTNSGHLQGKPLDDWEIYFSNLGSNNSFLITNNLNRFKDIVVSILFYYMNNEDFESITNHRIPSIKIELEYKNILNKEFKESYIIDVNPLVYGTEISSTFAVNLKNKYNKY
ncbi:hypothetical protein GKD08_04080 [Paeniclostridium sordellii]|uniref:hypothetical protein n=1 Tax=Clostridia TaxID=186801 RepID=UPI0012B13BF8|nr:MULTISPECIES: hypothetical protein [Clostridia]MDU4415257.1 hypothetical protein [Paeniclostridium sordellii]MDU4477929.1 hypothetical protein [Clostridium sp.]MRZ27941.1 hypothetical protein [Paeniclostridium sordellii]